MLIFKKKHLYVFSGTFWIQQWDLRLMFKRANLHWLTTSTYVDLVAFSHVINFMGSSKMLLPWPVFPSILGITAKKWLTIPTRSTQEKYKQKKLKGQVLYQPVTYAPAGRSCAGTSRRHRDTPSCVPSSLLLVGLSLTVELPECMESRQFHWGVFSILLAHWSLNPRTGWKLLTPEFLPAAGLHRQHQVPAPPSSVCQGCCLLWIVRPHCHRSLKGGGKAWESTETGFLPSSFSLCLLERQTQFPAPQGTLFAWTCFFCPLR